MSEANVAGASERYLALGDSFTIGTGTTPDRSFPAALVTRWAAAGRTVALRNPAVNGYATDDLIREELPLARDFRPTLVTLLIGANDIVRGGSGEKEAQEARYRERLRTIHAGLAAAGVAPASIVTLPQQDWSASPAAAAFGRPADHGRAIERFNAIAKEEAERAGGRYIDIFPLMREQARRGMVASDGLHPSAEAYAAWAAELEQRLR